MSKVSAHPATDDFGVPEVNSSGQCDSRDRAERGGSSHNRSDIARILNGIEHEDDTFPIILELRKRTIGHFSDGNYSLGRFSFRGRRELVRRHILDVHAARTQCVGEGGASRRIEKLRRDQRAANTELRLEQLFDSAHAFTHEETLAFTRFATLEVAG
jgi:hypothetical protein